MQGAPSRAIQELAGHRDLGTTQRYMHLSPAALEAAIRLLRRANPRLVEPAGRRRELRAEMPGTRRKNGGGGGSRTRVREHAIAGVCMRSRS